MLPGYRVRVKHGISKEFPQLLDADCINGIIESVKQVAGLEVCLVTFENGVIKKLPSCFLVRLCPSN